jgi:hypothetical protein
LPYHGCAILIVSLAETDSTFPRTSLYRATDILAQNKKQYHVQVFSGVSHGFATRADPNDPNAGGFLRLAIDDLNSLLYVDTGSVGQGTIGSRCGRVVQSVRKLNLVTVLSFLCIFMSEIRRPPHRRCVFDSRAVASQAQLGFHHLARFFSASITSQNPYLAIDDR